jgi:hypothetical protein
VHRSRTDANAMDVYFRTHVRTPTGSRIIAGTAEVVSSKEPQGWQLRSAYINETGRTRAADFWELVTISRYLHREEVSERVTKAWNELKEPAWT